MTAIRKKAIKGLKSGDTLIVRRTFTEADTKIFGDISKDYNPIHYDERYASVKNMKGRICHGLLVGSMVTEIGGQVGWLASRMNFHFRAPVYFGDTIECRLTITKIDSRGRAGADAVFHNQEGIMVMEAELEGIVPGKPECKILDQMMREGDPTNRITDNSDDDRHKTWGRD
ncbi:MAG: acyl dehydratase [Desulfobacteraceae bacterium 4572_123]|nr:MAG: acyl dehydratase [Desulfobacteraceae bacterium 4572_123]